MTETRKSNFQRNQNLESLLGELNDLLGSAEQARIDELTAPQLPVVFVIGAPRSGTTLTMQWLASTGHFAYPTNLMSRFYAAPYTGALINELLTNQNYHYRDEFKELQEPAEGYTSAMGKTSGIREPNEYWYFWRRFFPLDVPQPLANLNQSDPYDVGGFGKGLAAIESVLGKPFATKGMLLQYDLDVLSQAVPKPIFVYTKRSLVHNVDSIRRARVNFYGNEETWYSAKPSKFSELENCDPITQITGQVVFTNEEIEAQLQKFDSANQLEICYESFCESPESVYRQLQGKFAELGHELPAEYNGLPEFKIQNRDLPAELTQQVESAVASLNCG